MADVERSEEAIEAKIKVGKNRNGAVKTFEVSFLPGPMLFREKQLPF